MTVLYELRDTSRALTFNPSDRSTPQACQQLIRALNDELASHFASEETDDYFGAMARERPQLVTRIAELRADHTRILETISSLSVMAAERRWATLAESAKELIELVQAHETAERLLLQEYFTREDS